MNATTVHRIESDADTRTGFPLATIGRLVYALPFTVFGLFHLASPGAMAGAVPAWVPGPGAFWVVVTGLAMIAASVSLATNKLVAWSGPLLALLLGTFVLSLHLPGAVAGDQMAIIGLLKDTALAGGALFLAGRKS